MSTIKRKIDSTIASDSALGRATKKKTRGGAHLDRQSHSSLELDRAADRAKYHPPSGAEPGTHHEHTILVKSSTETRCGPSRAMPVADKQAKQCLLDEQVAFIIHARDNNNPDPHGVVSSTFGPLPWSVVAELYNQKYGVSVGGAAMEKRTRQHRAAWLAKHPRYPVDIVYAAKIKAPSAPRSRVAKPQARQKEPHQKTQVYRRDAIADRTQTRSVTYTPNSRIGGWTPPDNVRNAADLNNYIDQSIMADAGHLTFEVFDAHEVLLGSVTANREDIRGSSTILRQVLDSPSETQIQLHCSSLAVVQRYVNCVSSEQLIALPANIGNELIELYCFAVQLQDDHVRRLVMNCWKRLSERNAELELDIEYLSLLFESTDGDDPARGFWAATVCSAGEADQVLRADGCHEALTATVQDLVGKGIHELYGSVHD